MTWGYLGVRPDGGQVPVLGSCNAASSDDCCCSAGDRRSSERQRCIGRAARTPRSAPPGVLKKGTAKKLRACDNAAHQQYRKAGLQLRRRRSKPVHRPKWRGQPPCRSPSHLVASTDAGASSEKPICDLAARQKRRSPLAGRWPAASQRDRNRSYRILLGLDKLRVGLKGLFLDFNCS